jgi:hypothetical protein
MLCLATKSCQLKGQAGRLPQQVLQTLRSFTRPPNLQMISIQGPS